MAHIHLVAWDNGRGLSHDVRLLEQALRALGHQTSHTNVSPGRRGHRWRAWRERLALAWRHLRSGRRQPSRYDVNIVLEHAHPAYFGLARRNLFIPNPEWLTRRDRKVLHRFDAILCKTQVAVEIFEGMGLVTRYIGFQSVDCRQPAPPAVTRFLHLAGASRMKGTQRLLALWRKHPEWPALLVLQSPATAEQHEPAPTNLVHRVEYVKDLADIRRLQNSHDFHLCLSETEGWGHYIVEGLSCGKVVITCDAPPMNELVRPERGLLVAATPTQPLNAAMRYAFDEAALERVIERAAAMPATERQALGQQARDWYEANQAGFGERLAQALRGLLP
jgi:glycosyltransferase involved in cell wall biosynthesis